MVRTPQGCGRWFDAALVLASLALGGCSSTPSNPFETGGAGGMGGADIGGAPGLGGGAGDGAGGMAGGAMAGSGGTAASGGMFDPPFMLGADISSVQETVDGGATFVDTDGASKGILEILKTHGFNYARLRAFVDPMALYGYANPTGEEILRRQEAYCDTEHTVEFAQQIKGAGMGLLLDLHYSDNWADPGKQIVPEAWRDAASIADLASRVSTYTEGVVRAMVEAGARPDMVQIGNEITPGMLIHVPSASPSPDPWGNIDKVESPVNGSVSNWDNLAALIKAGIAGVKNVDPEIKIMLHVENTEHVSGVTAWVNEAKSRDVEFDVLGLSCYTAFQGEPSTWQATFTALATTFPDLSFVIAEYNPERTQANEIMRALPDGRGLGTFFWEPTQSGVWGSAMFTWSNGVFHANAEDFGEFATIRQNVGL